MCLPPTQMLVVSDSIIQAMGQLSLATCIVTLSDHRAMVLGKIFKCMVSYESSGAELGLIVQISG